MKVNFLVVHLKLEKKQSRIILYKRIKNASNGGKVLLIKNKDNPFYMQKEKNSNDDLKSFFKLKNEIMVSKINKGEIECINFNDSDKKIKNLGFIASNIVEINSIDPRLLLIWNYNRDINIKLWFKGQIIDNYNYATFSKEFPSFNIANKEHWKKFLSFFPSKYNDEIPGFGKAGLKKVLRLINESELQNTLSAKRIEQIQKLIGEMA